jgi:ACT domain-containing protein
MDRQSLAVAVAQILVRHLPQSADEETVAAVVADLVAHIESRSAAPEADHRRLVVVTVMGKNHSGIVHAFSEVLAENAVDIVDINQTLVHGNFAMMMIVDLTGARCDVQGLKAALKKRGEEVGVQVYCQYEDIMRAVNRI